MSLQLLNEYEADFTRQLQALKATLLDTKAFTPFLKSQQDPPEYTHLQTLLKQMEIESMNFMGSEEYMKNLRDGDAIRKKIQKNKRDLDQIRKEMR